MQIAKRLLGRNVLRDVELGHVAIYDLVGDTIISIGPTVPGHDDTFLIQHGQRTTLLLQTHGSVHVRAASQQDSPAP